jgi:LytTr DNA-binding domain
MRISIPPSLSILRSTMPLARTSIEGTRGTAVETVRDEAHGRREKPQTPGTTGVKAGTSGMATVPISRRAVYIGLVAMLAAFCGIEAFSTAHDLARGGRGYDLRHPIIWELTSATMILALLPLLRYGVDQVRKAAGRPIIAALAAILTAVAFSAAHIAGMVLLRKSVYAVSGETYQFPWSLSEIFYEFRKDLLTYAVFSVVIWLGERLALVRPIKAPAASELWLRDGAASIRIDPQEILWVASAGNYIEYALAGGRRHLVRGTLTREEARLEPFGVVRVHRTRLINLRRTVVIEPRASGDFEIRLDSGETIAGSRRYRAVCDRPDLRP